MSDQTPRVPELWWSEDHEEVFLCIDGAYYVAQVEAEENPLGAGRPSDAVKLGDVKALQALLDQTVHAEMVAKQQLALIGRLLTGWDTDDVPPATIRRIRAIVEGENR
ncbi:hypothetical protein VSH64_24970 [Amycolatopsis rhabdoformis]|uniref:Tail assembly chaperone n=1 Tax=Amycolatopsis rhabdoformis TaxID=1448059 RepID=A0ABZ1HUV1_9PSEU|nr:hypothetical protein [Amycolatopsis rhabdoformis]WSE26131.1 hypothetical protein VSH64_24970 [Amycolatopsis rhabdoformis]